MQVFLTNLDLFEFNEALINKGLSELSEDERRRFHSTKSLVAQKQLLLGRVLLRKLISEKLNCASANIQFSQNIHGRLELHSPIKNLNFNLSHSKNWLGIAFAEEAVGLDLEFMKERNYTEIARQLFSQTEINYLEKNLSKENFYILWTLRESFIKCLGESLFYNTKDKYFKLCAETTKIEIPDCIKEFSFASYKLKNNFILSTSLNLHKKDFTNTSFQFINNLFPLQISILKNLKLLFSSS